MKVTFEQIDTAAMDGHRRGIGHHDALLRHHFENPMLARGIASVGFEGQGYEALVVANVGADFHHECEVNALEEFHGSADDIRRRPRTDPAEQA